jgi:prepilin-type N-terminal cleavage/methylation domain-containing protein
MPDNRDSAQAGFTLLEVIVALVILTAALLAFYEFLSTAIRAAERVWQAAEAYDRERNGLALAASLNPMATPTGELDLGTYRVRWRAERIGPSQQSTEYPSGGPGRFTVALYRIVIDFPGSANFAPLEVTKLGYHRDATPPGIPSDPPN